MTALKPIANEGRNRRKTRRKSPRGSVRIEWRPGTSARGKGYPARLLDISEGGICIVVSEELIEDKVDISLTGPSLTKPIKRFAKVSWSLPTKEGEFCVGLSFQRNLTFAEFLQIGIQTEAIRRAQERESPDKSLLALYA